MKKFLLLLVLIIGMNITLEEKSHAYDSLLEYETYSSYGTLIGFLLKSVETVIYCVGSQFMLDPSELNKNCIPRLINADPNFDKDCDDSYNSSSLVIALQAMGPALFITIVVAAFVAALFFVSTFVLAFLAIPILLVITSLITPCFSTYLLSPHEYINAILGHMKCEKIGNSIMNTHPEALSAFDVPFFYNCLNEPVPPNIAVGDKATLDKHYGNMNQPGSPYCQGPAAEFALNNLAKKSDLRSIQGIKIQDIKPGSMIVGNGLGLWGFLYRQLYYQYCNLDDGNAHKLYHITREQIRQKAGDYYGFFRLYSGKIQLCAATFATGFALFRVGCTSVAPPIEQTEIDLGYAEQTRCQYFLGARKDLQSLGYALNKGKNSQTGFSAVGLFLSGDLHVMSTVVGCIQDLLVKIVVGFSQQVENSFLYQVQKAFLNIVKVMLILYLSVLAIKIMSAPQAPQMGEVALYIIKFALVIVFTGVAGPSIWYNKSDDSSTTSGLYSMILEASNSLADTIIQGTNNITPIPMCYHDDGNANNLLSEREVPQGKYGNLDPTVTRLKKDANSIKLTLWDYLDCKIATYLNFNSCKFSLSHIAGLWIGSLLLFNITTFIVGILCLIFSIVVFINIVRFVHIALINMFAITILVLISPIMISFALFEYTKQTFQTWFKTILGYILYPALVLSFISLMIVTFDSIFYGTPVNKDCMKTASCTIKDICGENIADNNSLYCVMALPLEHQIKNLPANLCTVKDGTFTALFGNPSWLGTYGNPLDALNGDFWSNLLAPLGKILLFAILFHNMMDAILGFFEALLSVYGISNLSLNTAALGRGAFNIAASIPKTQSRAMKKVFGGLKKAKKNNNNPGQ